MGPRLKDVEDLHSSERPIDGNRCFNGATSQGRGRPGRPATDRSRRTRFNGATSQGRGRRCDRFPMPTCCTCFNGATSQGRGRRARFSIGSCPPSRFNGATSQGRGRRGWTLSNATHIRRLQWGHVSRTWKTRVGIAVTPNTQKASMGPRLKDVEDAQSASGIPPCGLCFNGATSQGRGRLRCGDNELGNSQLASMGPRLKDVEDSMSFRSRR